MRIFALVSGQIQNFQITFINIINTAETNKKIIDLYANFTNSLYSALRCF